MPVPTYQVTNNVKEMQFEVILNGEKAYLSYRFYKKDIALMHTFVPEVLSGNGIASALAVEAFKFAASNNKLVMVYCPYVAKFLTKHPEYNSQVDPQYRGPASNSSRS